MTDESTDLQVVVKQPAGSSDGQTDHGARETRESSPELARELEREFETIYRREFPLALRFARRYVDDAAAEDAVQSVFMKFWEGYTQTPALVFRPDAAHTQAAILTAVRNELGMAARHAKTILDKAGLVRAAVVDMMRNSAGPERPSAELELSEVVARALDRLPARQREVFALVKFDEKSYDEAAEILGISPKTVHQLLVKANARLRAMLAEYRVPDPDWSYLSYNEDVRSGRKDAQP
jgi:RNA polymerase sigma-70 factor (ECF subfamily)